MPDRVQRPAQGGTYRVVRRRYVDGSFIIEGRRVRKALCKLADVERAPSGKKRTAKQIHDAIEAIWEAKRRALAEGLDDGWCVFHSMAWLGLGPDGAARDGEADFIIAHLAHGALVLEVKGGEEIRFEAATGG